jgi:NADH-quinone oxidoreductase subunit H
MFDFIFPYLPHSNLLDVYIYPLVFLTIKLILAMLLIVFSVAYLTWIERKIHGAIHLRKGPNVVGPLGLLQPLADGLKLLLKETIIPSQANKFLFFLAPSITFVIAIIAWAVIPVGEGLVFVNINFGALYLLAVSSLGVYGIIIAGWASNSQYSFLGAIRSSSQMISYELSMGLIVLSVVLFVGSFNLTDIVLFQKDGWFIIKLLPLGILFFIVGIAETNRHPFDLPESEAEIVSGYHTEYSGFAFALFYLGEYANMILISSFTTLLFLGGWLPPLDIAIFNIIPSFIWFVLKVLILLIIMIQLKTTLPRYRYDQLMRLGWKIFLPISLCILVIISTYITFSSYISVK